jgi:hypothetical protein
MLKSLPTDIRQFGIRLVMGLIFSFALAFGFWRLDPTFGYFFAIFVVSAWFGLGTLFVSDMLDQGPIDERRGLSQGLSAFGSLLLVISLFGAISVIVLFASARFRSLLM